MSRPRSTFILPTRRSLSSAAGARSTGETAASLPITCRCSVPKAMPCPVNRSCFWVSVAGSGNMFLPSIPPCSLVKATERGRRGGGGSAAQAREASEGKKGSPRVKPPAPRSTCLLLDPWLMRSLREGALLELGRQGHLAQQIGDGPLLLHHLAQALEQAAVGRHVLPAPEGE